MSLTPFSRAASRMLKVPLRLVERYNSGSWMDGRTPARAAKWITAAGFSAKAARTAALSRMSPSTTVAPGRRSRTLSRLIAGS